MTYQRNIYDEALRLTPMRRVAVDCGAHVGIFTRRMEIDFNRVYAFEPNPENFRCLAENTETARLFNCCLWSENTLLDMRLEDHPNSGAPEVSGVGSEYLGVPLDAFGLDEVDLIKLDVQGSELPVLFGAMQTLDCRPTIIIEMKGNVEDVRAFLRGLEYTEKARVSGDEVWIPGDRA